MTSFKTIKTTEFSTNSSNSVNHLEQCNGKELRNKERSFADNYKSLIIVHFNGLVRML